MTRKKHNPPVKRNRTEEAPPSAAESFIASGWRVPAALALLHLIIAFAAFHPTPFTGGDDATYIALARALLQRHAYVDMWDPALAPQTLYPPVFPVIVAIGLSMHLSVAVGLKMMMVVLSSAAVFASCIWLWRTAKPGPALAAGLFVALSPEIISLGREILSDTPFWLFTMIALIAFVKIEKTVDGEEPESSEMPWRWELIASLAIVAAYFTRSAGLPLLLAALLWLIAYKRKRAVAILLATSLPFIIAWWLRGRAHDSTGYLGPFLYIDPYVPARGTVHFHDLFVRLQQNLFEYRLNHIPRIILGEPFGRLIPGTLAVFLAAFGWVRRIRKPGVAELWTFFYLGLVLLWPVSWSAPRFLLAIIPVLALYTMEAIAFAVSFVPKPRIVGGILTAGLVLAMIPPIRHHLADGERCRGDYADGDEFPCTEPIFRDFFLTASAVKGQLPDGSVVISRKPTLFYLYSGYQSRLYPLSRVPDSLFAEADSIHAKFLVIDQIQDLAPLYLYPILLARRDDFCVIPEFSHPNATFTRIERGGPPRPPGSAPNVFRACPMRGVAANSAK